MCINCGPCDLGCPQGARSSADLVYWPSALRHGAVLHTNARVAEITLDERGRADGAAYFDGDGVLRQQRAQVVVVACSAIGTPRLLLASRSERFPDGLANSSGLVGKRLMMHPIAMVTGVFDEPLDGYKGPFVASLVCQHFYETDAARDFVRGYQMQLCRSNGPLGTAFGLPYLPRIDWGADHHRDFLEQFAHGASLAVTAEDLPDERNAVTLDPALTDAHGIPAPAVRYCIDENSRAILDHGIARAGEALAEAGAAKVLPLGAIDVAFHLLGTARRRRPPYLGLRPLRPVARRPEPVRGRQQPLRHWRRGESGVHGAGARAANRGPHPRDATDGGCPCLGSSTFCCRRTASCPAPGRSASRYRCRRRRSRARQLAELLDRLVPDEPALRALEAERPDAFAALVELVYVAYYTDPRVLAHLEAATGYPARPPQPHGHPLEPFDERVLATVRARTPHYRRA